MSSVPWYLEEPGPARRWADFWRMRAAGLPHELSAARRQGFVLRSAQLTGAGITRSRARNELRKQVWTPAGRGAVGVVDVRAGEPDRWLLHRRHHALRTAGAVLHNPNHLARLHSAAILHGLPTFGLPETPELVVHPKAATGRHAATSDATLTTADLTRWWGVNVTTPARTITDLLRNDRCSGLMAADAALFEDLVGFAELAGALETMAGWPGVRQARELLTLASARSESPLESLVRLRLHDEGFPPPMQQVEIPVPGRSVPYRVDFLWPSRRLVLEADGRDKYDHAALARERGRDKLLRRLGYRVERVFWSDVVHDWPATRALLRSALA